MDCSERVEGADKRTGGSLCEPLSVHSIAREGMT
jgi:hypothetical protein